MKPVFLLIVIFLCSLSCKQKFKHYGERVITMNQTRPINELKELVLKKGDIAAYDELSIAYLNEKYLAEYLLYSIIMADKYNYPRAYFQVYHCLTYAYKFNLHSEFDEDTKNLALKYLKMGAELRDPESMEHLGNLYLVGKYVPKDTILGKKLEEEGRKLCGF